MPPELDQAPEKEVSLNDQVSAAFDELEEAGPDDSSEENAPPEEPGEESAETSPEAPAAEDRPAPLEYNEPAPGRWPAEIATIYNNLPAAAKQAMMEGFYKPMQRQYTAATQELAEQRATVTPLVEVLSRFRGDFERAGIDPVTAFTRQMQWAAHLAQVGPEQGLRDMAKSYGVASLATDPQQQQEEYLTPFERAAKQKLEMFEAWMNDQRTSAHQAQVSSQEQAFQQRSAEVYAGLNTFISEQNDGQPAHPHVEALAPYIASLIEKRMVPDADEYGRPLPITVQLEYAYRQALAIASKVGGGVPQTDQRQVRRIKAARDVGVVTKLPAGKQESADRPISEDINDVFDALSRRVS